MTASTGTFVSCTDYDDDIDNLQGQIDKLAGKAELDSQVSSLSSQISAAQGAADAAKTAAAAAQAAADAAKSVADSKLDEAAVKAIAEAAAEGAAAAAKEGKDAAAVAQAAAEAAKAAADAAQATADKGVSDAEAAQKAADAAAEAAQAVAAKLADYATKAELKAAQEVAAAAAAAAQKAGLDAAKVAEAAAAAAQKTADEAVAAAKKAAAEAAAAKKDGAAAAEALAQAAAAAQKTADDAVAAAKKAAADAAAAQATADEAVAAAAAAQGAAAAAQATADAAQAAAEKVATDLATLEVRVKALEAAVEAAATQEELNNLKELVDKLNEDSAEFLNIVSKRLTSLVFAPQTYIDGIETINFQTFLYADWGEYLLRDKADFKLDADGKKTEVEEDDDNAKQDADGKYYAAADIVRIGDNSATAQYLVNPAGVTLNGIKELAYIGQDEATNQIRQTRALGAAPIKVVDKDLKDGVLTVKLSKVDQDDYLGHGFEEVVRKKFTIVSLKATLADEVLTASEKDAEVNVFSDWTRLTETVVTPYIANGQPSNRDSEDNLICDEWASHYWPFSSIYDITAEKPLEKVYDEDYYWGQNGDLDYSDYIGASAVYNKPFDLMSLVTVCAGWDRENYNELKNYEEYGLEFEFHVMPYLFDNEEETVDATPQDKFAKLAEDKHTLIPTSRDGQEYNANAIGRTPVIQIVLKDKKHDDAVVDVRYTMIQWVADAPSSVVWTPAKYPDLSYEKVAFKCTGNYVNEIREKYMNNLYANIKDGGMTKSEFHSTYKKIFDKSFYAYTYTYKDANNKDVVKTYSLSEIEELLKSNDAGSELAKLRIGKAKNLYDWDEPNQTYNIQISVDADDYRLPQDDKDFTIEGFFFFENSAGTSRVIIPVEFEVVRGTLENKYKYLQTQWLGTLSKENKDKTRPANPTLISDKTLGKDAGFVTTQLISDITYGYMANGQTPANFRGLAIYKNGTWKDGEAVVDRATDVVFDAARLSLLPDLDDLTERDNAGNVTKTFGWAVTEDGKTLYYAAKGSDGKVLPADDATASIAAQVDQDNNKTVYLCDNALNTTIGTANAEPTPAALRLVGCKKVPVKVVAEACDNETVDFDQYLIWFIDPLKWKEGSKNIPLKDVENYGGEAQAISIGDQFTLEENFGSKTKLYLYDVYDAKGNKVHAATTALNNWYGIKNVVMAAKSEWLINIDADGVINDNSSSKLLEVTNSDDEPLYDLILLDENKDETTDISKVKFVKYHNNSGQAITKNIVIKVPVSLDTKWNKGKKNYITVTIEPNYEPTI